MFVFFVVVLFIVSETSEGKLPSICGPDEFPCNDGSCIEKLKWCDSKEDCNDDSDEHYCYFKTSLSKNPNRCNESLHFLCNDGRCIPLVGRCDGLKSCTDNSDEEHCNTSVSKSVTSTTPLIKNVTESSIIIDSINVTKTLGGLYVHEDILQKSNILKSVTSTGAVESMSFHDTEQADFTTLQSFNSSSSNVYEHFDVVSTLPSTNHQQALKFEDLIDNMLKNSSNTDMPKTSEQNNDAFPGNSTMFHEINQQTTNFDNVLGKVSTVPNNISYETSARHMDIQADMKTSRKTSKEENLREGYFELDYRPFRRERSNALEWLLKSRDSDYGWREETARALTAVHMLDDGSLGKQSPEKMLMSKQLHLKLFMALNRNETKNIDLSELSIYINALSASCDDPKNFHGHDLVNILRYRTDGYHRSSKFVTPFVYLVLCVNNATNSVDVRKIREMLHDTPKITKIDIAALMLLTTTCITRIPKFSALDMEQIAAKKLYKKVIGGLPENIYELALVTQALNEARINQDLWNRAEAMHRISSLISDRSFGDILSTYYIAPLLSGTSLISIGQNCPNKNTGLVPLEVLENGKDDKMYVRYSLYFGNPIEVSQNLMFKVQKTCCILDIMRIAENNNPIYKFHYDMKSGKPSVYSIGGIVNDAEKGIYWILHVSRQNSTKDLVPLEDDIRNYVPSLEDHVVFWLKSIF